MQTSPTPKSRTALSIRSIASRPRSPALMLPRKIVSNACMPASEPGSAVMSPSSTSSFAPRRALANGASRSGSDETISTRGSPRTLAKPEARLFCGMLSPSASICTSYE